CARPEPREPIARRRDAACRSRTGASAVRPRSAAIRAPPAARWRSAGPALRLRCRGSDTSRPWDWLRPVQASCGHPDPSRAAIAAQIVTDLGPTGEMQAPAVGAHEPARQSPGLEPFDGALAADDRGGRGDVGIQAGPGRDAHGPPD